MSIVSSVKKALHRPDLIYPYFRVVGRSLHKMVSVGKYREAIGYLTEEVLGNDLYLRSVASKSGGLVTQPVKHGELLVDASDPGLSRRLLRYGVHEETSSKIYEQELVRLREDVDGEIGVLEIGANLGYFLLIATSLLGERAKIYAVEPHPENLAILRENVGRNGLNEQVEVIEGAVGSETGSAVLNIMPKSNWHRVDRAENPRGDALEAIDVDLTDVETLLTDRAHSPDDIHVVRFDVEGYEPEIFNGMTSVLEAAGPLLLYVEFHLVLLDDETVDRLVSMLSDSGLEIVSGVVYDPVEWDGERVSIETFDEFWEYRDIGCLEIIARREGTSTADTTRDEAVDRENESVMKRYEKTPAHEMAAN